MEHAFLTPSNAGMTATDTQARAHVGRGAERISRWWWVV